MFRNAWFAVAALALYAPALAAHPVPKDTHDRTIVVRLQKADAPHQVRIRIEYRLEADEGTIRDGDMIPFRDVVNPLNFRGQALKYYAEFAKTYAPIYADNVLLRVNQKLLEPAPCISRRERLEDEEGKPLGHLRCDFVFVQTIDLDPAKKTHFSLYEKNYWLQEGQITLSLVNETGLAIENKIEPDEALRKRAKESPEPEDEDRLREVSVVFVPWAAPAPAPAPTTEPAATPPGDSKAGSIDWFDLDRLIFNTDYGFWLIMFLAFLFGAAHALTPGHGKTLVAAYLVGERGTVWHALYLGLITTLTHTGAVLLLAIILTILPAEQQLVFKSWIQNGLGLIMGMIVACMGFWLLLQRLSGRADHIHLGGGHHHHHAEHGTTPPAPRSFGWWGLTVLGITGGIIPCPDAIGVLFYAVGTSEIWLVLPAVLIFSAGLATVLVVIGVLVVQVPRMVESRYGSGRLLHALPIVSALLVTLLGLWICYKAVPR